MHLYTICILWLNYADSINYFTYTYKAYVNYYIINDIKKKYKNI